MIRAVALNVGAGGIWINNVNPGAIKTPKSMGTPDKVMTPLAAHAALKGYAIERAE